jgi:folate-binding protein YgfZ
VDLKGRIVAVADQAMLSAQEILLVIEGRFLERLRNHLEKYLFLMDTKLEEEIKSVYFDLEGSYVKGADETVIPQKKGALVVTDKAAGAHVSEEEFTLFRVQNFIPIQGIDFDRELLLEVCDEEYVSYTKGCYLGQEIIARVHHRSRPARRLIVLREDLVSLKGGTELTSKVRDPQTGQIFGFSFVKNDQPC